MSQSPKSKWTVAVLGIVLAFLVWTSLRFVTDGPDNESEPPLAAVAPEVDAQVGGPTIHESPIEPNASSEDTSGPCLTLEQLETHPEIAKDAYRYDAVMDSGPVIAAYRGLSEQQLRDLTAQGDSAAMVVLGAMSVMRAREWPVEKAVPYLMLEDRELMAFTISRPLSPEFVDHMRQARQWFYRAALHGRVMVLYRVGESLIFEQGGPVEIGWISKEEYDGLSNREKMALYPANVYSALAFEVAPGLRSGPTGEILTAIMPRTERQQVVVDQLAQQFERDRKDAGLPPVVVSESSLASFDDLLLLLCESERDRVETLREKVR